MDCLKLRRVDEHMEERWRDVESRGKVRGYIAIVVTLVLWSSAVIAIKILTGYYDVVTQSFYRYAAAALTLWIIAAVRGIKSSVPWSKLFPASLLVFTFQLVVVEGIRLTTPTVAALLMRFNVVLVNAMSYVFFKDERSLISSPRYLAGMVLAFLGAVGLAVEDFSEMRLDVGALAVLAGTVFWACYTVYVRSMLSKGNPLSLSSRVFSLASLMFLAAATACGDLSAPLRTPHYVSTILVVSGALCVGVGNYMYYIALRELGASLTSSLQLLIPIITSILSFTLINEPLNFKLATFGSVLLTGCALIMLEAAKTSKNIRA